MSGASSTTPVLGSNRRPSGVTQFPLRICESRTRSGIFGRLSLQSRRQSIARPFSSFSFMRWTASPNWWPSVMAALRIANVTALAALLSTVSMKFLEAFSSAPTPLRTKVKPPGVWMASSRVTRIVERNCVLPSLSLPTLLSTTCTCMFRVDQPANPKIRLRALMTVVPLT